MSPVIPQEAARDLPPFCLHCLHYALQNRLASSRRIRLKLKIRNFILLLLFFSNSSLKESHSKLTHKSVYPYLSPQALGESPRTPCPFCPQIGFLVLSMRMASQAMRKRAAIKAI